MTILKRLAKCQTGSPGLGCVCNARELRSTRGKGIPQKVTLLRFLCNSTEGGLGGNILRITFFTELLLSPDPFVAERMG